MFDLEVTIIGGGIGGLTTGLFLRQHGYSVHVYERAPEILPVGAAISLWGNGVKVMNRLGLGKQMVQLGGQMNTMVYKNATGTENATGTKDALVHMPLAAVYAEVGERCYPVSRAELQQTLMDEFVAAGGALTLGRTCVGVEQERPGDADSRVLAVLDDGSRSAPSDLLIGADGIRSCVRDFVLEGAKPATIRYHYTNWNGLVQRTEALGDAEEWVMYVGEGKRASLMPVGGDRLYFFLGAPLAEDAPAPEKGSEAMRAELQHLFAGWPEQVQSLLGAIDVAKLNRIPICDLDPIDSYSRGRVVLVGDSKNAMTPCLGQGGAQAMEDAEVLASFLTTTNVSVRDACRRYEQHRKTRVRTMVIKARERATQIYPKTEAEWKETRKWYEELATSEDIGANILSGITANLMGGPWPPRL